MVLPRMVSDQIFFSSPEKSCLSNTSHKARSAGSQNNQYAT